MSRDFVTDWGTTWVIIFPTSARIYGEVIRGDRGLYCRNVVDRLHCNESARLLICRLKKLICPTESTIRFKGLERQAFG